MVISAQRWSAVYILTHPSFSCSYCLPQTPQKMRAQSHQVRIIIVAHSSEPLCAKSMTGAMGVVTVESLRDGGGRIVCSRPCSTAWDPVLNISRRVEKAHSCRFVISSDPLLLLPVKPQCSRGSCLVNAQEAARMSSPCPSPLDSRCGQCGRVPWSVLYLQLFLLFVVMVLWT